VLGSHNGSRTRIGENRPTDAGLPLIIAGPGIPQGVELEQPLSFLDLAPTMATILGLAPHPDWQGSGIESQFFRPSLELIVRAQKKTARHRQEGLAA